MERALPILNAAQAEVNLWLVAHSIPCQPHFDSVDMDVESHSAAFRIRHGRVANWMEEADVCDELWGDPIYLYHFSKVFAATGTTPPCGYPSSDEEGSFKVKYFEEMLLRSLPWSESGPGSSGASRLLLRYRNITFRI
ncbi:MAG: hypothetical protein GVY36_00510 [Verrucomicrobia bacterium]|jgi:hypothetical protein|nr:hypothetical protein [Verrucomicrobiota bacterium]